MAAENNGKNPLSHAGEELIVGNSNSLASPNLLTSLTFSSINWPSQRYATAEPKLICEPKSTREPESACEPDLSTHELAKYGIFFLMFDISISSLSLEGPRLNKGGERRGVRED